MHTYANNVVGHATFTIGYLRHARKEVGKHWDKNCAVICA